MKNRSRGFTLMELMIVLAVAGIILAIGAPSFSEFRRGNRMAGVANDFLVGVQIARSEAIKRQTGVSLCPSDDPEADEPVCSDVAKTSFAGWIVFADPNNNCEREDDPLEVVLQIGPRIDSSPSSRMTSSSDGNCIAFAATGFIRPVPGTDRTIAQHTLFCDERGVSPQPGTQLSSARGIDLSPTGRARITRVIEEINSADFGVECT